MIFIKWSVNWFVVGTDKAPSIITQLMNIFLAMGKVGETPLWGSEGTQESFHFYVLSNMVFNYSYRRNLHSSFTIS